VKVLYGTAFLAPSPYQAYSHYGSFYSTDGGSTYASSYWHVGNPDLEPQHKRTLEVNVQQTISDTLAVSASTFYSRFTNLLKEADADHAYAGLYHGWPVDYIDFPVNEGHQTTYGGTLALDFAHAFSFDHYLEARAALSLADGRVWAGDTLASGLPIGAMAPVQFRLSADFDWARWTLAPRLGITSAQRLLATTGESGYEARRTLSGYSTVDVNVRRRQVVKNIDAFLTIENAGDRRYRTINARAYNNPEELVGAPQNPRRLTIGVDVRVP
jgi:outer membrane cobalamin receptor